jgi:glycosyltransferase involved in cell wall biosynthesis
VTETVQGIVPARNRAIEESLESEILVFIDDDELPLPGLLEAASNAVLVEGADCVGGPIRIEFDPFPHPKWLDDELAGFLGALDYGPTAFWVRNAATPVWSGNVAYRMQIFRDSPNLRFDPRYNREGAGIGGGSDAIMFRNLLKDNYKIRYRPDMVIKHLVDGWKLRRGYFLRLHYRAGLRHGRYQLPDYRRTLFGIPPFLAIKFLKQALSSLGMQCLGRPGALRQGMNAANTLGMMAGYRRRAPDGKQN